MEPIIAAALVAVGLIVAALVVQRRPSVAAANGHAALEERPAPPASGTADGEATAERIAAAERRLADAERRTAELERRERELVERERDCVQRERDLERQQADIERLHADEMRALERAAGMSASQAKAVLLKDIEDQARHDSVRIIRDIEDETKRDAERRVRSILSVAMQRPAASHATETTVSVVQLPADDMKGRIIGREGRNIRALENLTGVDFIIDDTPNAVGLSAFDGVRREIARMTLEKLLQDGRIHPARIEETYYQAKSELEGHIVELGEAA